jgi:hypothetical protein
MRMKGRSGGTLRIWVYLPNIYIHTHTHTHTLGKYEGEEWWDIEDLGICSSYIYTCIHTLGKYETPGF